MTEAEYLNITDCARYFGVSEMTIRRYMRAGRIHAVRAGTRWMVELASVRKWLPDTPEVRKVLGNPTLAEAHG
jgi:excisionase family DNA binding protein